jgi:hypothetical protein
MDANIELFDDDGNKKRFTINNKKLHKMIFIFNALEDGWTIKKRKKSYFLLKNHEGKKEIFLDTYLTTFMKEYMDINKLISQNEGK